MAMIALHLDDADAQIIGEYAKYEGKDISDFIYDAVFEHIEDQADLVLLRKAIDEDDGMRYSSIKVLRKLNLQ